MPIATTHSNAYPALYRACMKEAAAQGRTLMQRLVVRARKSLSQRATLAPDASERNLLTESARILMKHEAALCEAYPQALLTEFAHAIAGDTRRAGGLSFDALELMGDDQMQETVELVRTQQAVGLAVDSELGELNALICAVQGLRTVEVVRNPLRPEVYVRSLRTVTLESPVAQTVRMRWMQHLGEAMGPELARVYQALSEMLRKEGVTQAGFSATPSPELRVSSGAAPDSAATDEGRARVLLTVRELRRLLSGEFDTEKRGPSTDRPADFSETVPAAFETLQEMRQVDQVIQRLQQRQAAGVIDAATGTAALRAELRKEARGVGQALGLEVVNLMVENIASDPRLLAPVQQVVRDLEPALLRLALGDPRFFSDKKHPARQLLEQMTQRSLAWQAVEAPGFAAFLEPLQQAVEALLTTRVHGPEPFDFALKSLDEAWGEQKRRDRSYREKAVRALLHAEQRNLLADRIAREMRARSDVAAAPREVAQFISGAWSQVMAQARLSDQTGASDPGGFAGAVADLLWSVQRRAEAGRAMRLGTLVAPLLDQLRRGLASISYPPVQTERFLALLAGLHESAATAPAEHDGAARSIDMAPVAREARGDDDEAGAWLAPSEARESGFMETLPSAAQPPLYQATQPGVDTAQLPGEAPDMAPALPQASLQPGAWVELFMDGNWSRYQLTWASPHSTLLMFTNAAGKTHSMTPRLLDKMLRGGSLQMVSGQPVVDGALDAVAHTALRNSLDMQT